MGKMRAMLNGGAVPEEMSEKLWAECASPATKLNNLIAKGKGKSPYEFFHEKRPELDTNIGNILYAHSPFSFLCLGFIH